MRMTLEGLETEINKLRADVIRARAIVSTLTLTTIGTADAVKAVALTNDQILKLTKLFDSRLDMQDERLALMSQRLKLLEAWNDRIKDLERVVKNKFRIVDLSSAEDGKERTL